MLLHALQPPPPLYAGMGHGLASGGVRFRGVVEPICARELEKFAEAELPKVDVTCVVELGDPAAVITEYAENENIGLIMMPTHGYRAFRRALLGVGGDGWSSA